MKRVMVVVAIVMVLSMVLSAGVANANPGYGGGYGGNKYIVRHGDTLSAIAFRFGVNPFELARANRIGDPNLIFVGECLIIPMRYQQQYPQPVFMPGPIYNQGYCQESYCQPYCQESYCQQPCQESYCQQPCQESYCQQPCQESYCQQQSYFQPECGWGGDNCYGGYRGNYGMQTGFNGWGDNVTRFQSKG
jgi:hypothetical protein